MVLQRCSIHPRGLSIAQQTRVYQLRKVEELQGSRWSGRIVYRSTPTHHCDRASQGFDWQRLGRRGSALDHKGYSKGIVHQNRSRLKGYQMHLNLILARCSASSNCVVAHHIALALGLTRLVALHADAPRSCLGKGSQKRRRTATANIPDGKFAMILTTVRCKARSI